MMRRGLLYRNIESADDHDVLGYKVEVDQLGIGVI